MIVREFPNIVSTVVQRSIREIACSSVRHFKALPAVEDDPLFVQVVALAESWVAQAPGEVGSIMERVSVAFAGNGAGISTLAGEMTPAELESLQAAFEAASPVDRRRAQANVRELGGYLAGFNRLASRSMAMSKMEAA